MFQWVTTMVNLEVFESTAMFGKEYSNALQFNIQRLYYENLKQAKDIVNAKVSAQEVQNFKKMPAFNELGPKAAEEARKFLAEEKLKLPGEELLFKKLIPEHRPQRHLLMQTLCH